MRGTRVQSEVKQFEVWVRSFDREGNKQDDTEDFATLAEAEAYARRERYYCGFAWAEINGRRI